MRLLSSCFNPWISFDDFEIREKGTSAKKVTLLDEKEEVDKICSEVRQSSDNAGENLQAVFFYFNTKTFSALNYVQGFGAIVKKLQIRSGLHSRKDELSRD